MYKIDFSRKVDTAKIPKHDLKRILDKIKELAKDPRPRWTEKVKSTDLLRTSIGDYRVLYKVDDKKEVIWIYDIDHRKDVYRQ